MSLSKELSDDLFGIQNMMKELLPENHEMAVFSREIYPKISDEMFGDYYSKLGRNGISPAFLAMVTMLQFRESLSDEETAEAVYLRLDWKYALHLPIEKTATFDSSTLCVFRKRLIKQEKESILFDKILEICQQRGFVKKNSRQRIDATHIVKHLNRISTTDLLFRAVKCLVEEIGKKFPDIYNSHIPMDIKERYENKFSSFGMSREKRADKQAEIVEDSMRIEKILSSAKEVKVDELTQLEIMKTIIKENVIIKTKALEDKEFIEVEERQCPKQSIFEPREPSIKLGKKGKLSWVGEKCHIVETANKGEINFIVDMIPQQANGADQKIHEELNKRNDAREMKPEKLYADGNYISTEQIKNYQENGQKLMGFVQKNPGNKEDGFRQPDFKIDLEKKVVTCPEGKVSCGFSHNKDKKYYDFRFSRKDCLACSKYDKCVSGKKERSRKISVYEDYELLRERREEQQTKEFREEMSVRAQVEGTISELTRKHGLRFIKYKGKPGRSFQYFMAGCALNMSRFAKKLYQC